MAFLKEKIELGIEQAELDTQKSFNKFPALFRWILILAAIGIIPGYYIIKNSTIKVWSGRYQQGALIAKPSFTNPKPPKVSEISLTTLGSGVYAAVVKVTNENLELSAGNITYNFSFYDANKQLIYTSPKDTFYLLPNQSKYISVPKFSATNPVAFSNFEVAQDIHWQKKLQVPIIKLVTSVPATYQQESPQAFVVEGDFLNQSPYGLKQVRLTFVLFNGSNKIIGISQRDEFTVNPFERRAYKQLWPNMAAGDLGKVEVVADTNSLDPNNLVVSAQSATPASDLSRP